MKTTFPSKRKNKKAEESLQIAVCEYLKLQYPDVIFLSESSGIRLKIGQAVKIKRTRSVGKLPDLIILEPRYVTSWTRHYHGLILELKKVGESPFLKKGGWSQDKHVQEQKKMLDRLTDKGYFASFAVGFDDAKRIIDKYMSWA